MNLNKWELIKINENFIASIISLQMSNVLFLHSIELIFFSLVIFNISISLASQMIVPFLSVEIQYWTVF